MAKEKDIFGGHNTGLINAGKEAVRVAKQSQAEKKKYAKKEIEHAVKHDVCDRIRHKAVNRKTISLPTGWEGDPNRPRRPGKTRYIYNPETKKMEIKE